MKRYFIIIAVAACVCGALAIIWFHLPVIGSVSTSRITEFRAHLAEVRPLLELCTTEIYREVPVKARIGSKHMFARQVLEGRIGFEIDSLTIEQHGDSLVVMLPPEKIVLNESTAPNSYEVIDTWKDKFWATRNFSTAEENAIKQKARSLAARRLYTTGEVACARRNAVVNLQSMLDMVLPEATVVVVDESPGGYPELNELI